MPFHTYKAMLPTSNNEELKGFYLDPYSRKQSKLANNYNSNNNQIGNQWPTNKINSICKMLTNKINIKSLGVAFFVVASIFCLYCILKKSDNKNDNKHHIIHLKLVNIFNRHGDRAPSDGLPKGDRHADNIELFWPNGLFNLTINGKFREFRIGLETRRHYQDYLDFNSTNILAFSSPIYRCKESMELILKGLYNIEWIKAKGRAITTKRNCTKCFSTGSGSPDEWKRVTIDTKTVPTLTYQHLNACKFRIENPSPYDSDLMSNPEIKSLNGVEQLKDIIKQRYDQNFNFTSLGLWSTIASEMNLVRTESTFGYTDHYNDWVNIKISNVTTKDSTLVPSLFELYEQVAVISYRDRIVGEANYIQSGIIVTSLIESQMTALGYNATNDRMKLYNGKKMILYSSHDSILQKLFCTLGIVDDFHSSTFEARFKRWQNSENEVEKFISGLKMSSFGMSARFELFELELVGEKKRYPYVQVSIYNKEDSMFQNIDYKHIHFGSVCRQLFKKKYPMASYELSQFYDSDFRIDQKQSCPFSLLLNITTDLIIDDKKLQKLCDNDGLLSNSTVL